MLEYVTRDPVRVQKTSDKARIETRVCERCGRELTPYEWYELSLIKATPYERKIERKIFTLEGKDKIAMKVIVPDWHRNRKGHGYFCKECADKIVSDILENTELPEV